MNRATVLHFMLIAVLGALIYSNTLAVPFQLDEADVIRDNPRIRDLSYFAHPFEGRNIAMVNRYMGYLTFALNYRLHGLNVTGYHVVNIALHIFNALLVYALLRLTLRATADITPPSPPIAITPPFPPLSLSGGAGGGGVTLRGGREGLQYVPLFVSLLFISHPVQTEAVNYVMGRLPLLMWFFYLSSMVLYAKWRLRGAEIASSGTPRKDVIASGAKQSDSLLYLLSLLCAVLAMKTKENALSLPFSIALYEFLFFSGSVKKRILYLFPFMLTLLIIPLTLLGSGESAGHFTKQVESASRHHTDTPRMSYLFTQFRVLATYIRLVFLPINQNFDYDYPLYGSFFAPQVILSFLFLAAVFSLGIYLVYASHKGNAALRLMGWGILWFFLTLSVESSIFPIPMIMCEYRLYAPMMGIVLFVAAALLPVMKRRAAISALVAITVLLTGASYARNTVWKNPIDLWEDVVRKSPAKARGHFNLASAYDAEGKPDKAIEHALITLSIEPNNFDAHTNLAIYYDKKGSTDKALEHFWIAVGLRPDYSAAYFNLGLVYFKTGLMDEARKAFEAALKLDPLDRDAKLYLGRISVSHPSRPPDIP